MVIESNHAMNALRKINKPISIIPQSGLPGREGILFLARTLNRKFVGLFYPRIRKASHSVPKSGHRTAGLNDILRR
jgi:hypothetical protein